MNDEKYWMVIVTASECVTSHEWEGKEIAHILARTPTKDEPDFGALMNVITSELGIGQSIDCALSLKIREADLDNAIRNKPSISQWDSENFELWILSRADNA